MWHGGAGQFQALSDTEAGGRTCSGTGVRLGGGGGGGTARAECPANAVGVILTMAHERQPCLALDSHQSLLDLQWNELKKWGRHFAGSVLFQDSCKSWQQRKHWKVILNLLNLLQD